MSGYANSFDEPKKYVDEELLKVYNKVWNKIKNILQIKSKNWNKILTTKWIQIFMIMECLKIVVVVFIYIPLLKGVKMFIPMYF